MMNTTQTAPTAKTYTIIRFTLVYKRSGATEPCWLETASFHDGPGMKVKKMRTTKDRSKAARFSLAQAHEIAVQFSQYPAALERHDGTAMPDETAKLQAEQRSRHERAQQIRAEINREFNEAFRAISRQALGR